MPRSLYLIDGHAQIYRAYFAPFGQLSAPSGEPTRATHVFWQMVLNLLKTRKPDYLALVLDVSDETVFRKAISPDYKAQREPPPEDLDVQIQRIVQIAEAISLPILRLPGFEADDVLATLATRHAGPDLHVYFVSRDKDLEQLLTAHVTLFDPLKNEDITPARLLELKGWPPEKALEAQTLIGDSVDNVAGVPGIGPKTAAKLIEKYGSAQGVIDHAHELTPRQRENVLAFAPRLEMTHKLLRLECAAPISFDLATADVSAIRWANAKPLFRELGFRKLQELLPEGGDGEEGYADSVASESPGNPPQREAHADPGAPGSAWHPVDRDLAPVGVPTPETPACEAAPSPESQTARYQVARVDAALRAPMRGTYRCIETPDALAQLVRELASQTAIAVDTETTALPPMDADLVGISLAWGAGQAAYVPVRCVYGQTLGIEPVRAALGPLLANEQVLKVAHHLKYDMLVLHNAGMELRGPLFDTMIAAFCVDPMRLSFGLDRLAMDVFQHDMIPITDLIGKGRDQLRMDQIPLSRIVEYAGEDADYTWRLYRHYEPALKAAGVERLFHETEMPLVRVLMLMEHHGVSIDADLLQRMNVDMGRRIADLADAVQQSIGSRFNIDSPKQLADVLFDQLKMRVVRRTKTARSTDAETLEALAAETNHPALKQILEYRELQKLRSTYIDALPAARSKRTSRLHTHYHQTGAITGRLSSSDPNLQNIPIRTELGREIRRAFVPRTPEDVLIVADYSQIELRLLADFSGDEALKQAFEQDRDIHAFVAAQVNGIPIEQVTSEQRSRAKAVNFGIVYGQTAFGLSRTTGMNRNDAQEFINGYYRRYGRIRAFMDKCIAEARRDQCVRTILGRRRPIMDIDSRNQTARAQAERLAVNTVVQGSAADLIKVAMIRLHDRIESQRLPLRMLLQVHDELVFEAPRGAADEMAAVIRTEMSGAMKLSVPLKVDVGIGNTWLGAK